MKKNLQGGYVGILSILIVAVIIGWIVFMKSDKAPARAPGAVTDTGTSVAPEQGSSYIETNLRAVDKARDAKASLEQSSRAIDESGF